MTEKQKLAEALNNLDDFIQEGCSARPEDKAHALSYIEAIRALTPCEGEGELSIEQMGYKVNAYFKENRDNLMGIEIGDTVAVYKPYHAEDGSQFIVEEIVPCETSWGKQFGVRGKPVNGGWLKGFSTPRLTIISKGNPTPPTVLLDIVERLEGEKRSITGNNPIRNIEYNAALDRAIAIIKEVGGV